ncbi:MAG: hypothetical protein ACLQPH_12570 [Acidimicrobiales bacterium]
MSPFGTGGLGQERNAARHVPTAGSSWGPPSSKPLWKQRLAVFGLALVLLTAALAVVGPDAVFSGRRAEAGAATACQSDGSLGCTVTLPCATAPCPSVDVSPATGLDDGQYVYVKATNFPAGDSMRVAVCSTLTSASDPSCLDGFWHSEFWDPVHVPINVNAASSNLTQAAVPAFLDPSGEGDNPLPAHDITNEQGAVSGFFCDDTTDPCTLEVTDEQGVGTAVTNPSVTASNTAIIPLQFAAQSSGCPSSDPVIQSDSSFSLEHFIPTAVESSCTGKGEVIDLNTATDNQTVVSDLADGGTDLGFVDDPGDPSLQKTLTNTHQPYAYIPVAVSATAVAFLGGYSNEGQPYPVSDFDLTPNMLAGLITTQYEGPHGSIVGNPPEIIGEDTLIPPLNCLNLLGCPGTKHVPQIDNEVQFDAFDLLNPFIGPTAIQPLEYGAFMSNVSNGASYQATDWLCNAPNTPYSVDVDEIHLAKHQTNPVAVSVTDNNVATATLTNTPETSVIWPPYEGAAWVYPTCHAYPQFPDISSRSSSYAESQSPALQAKSLRSYAYNGGSLPSFTDPSEPTIGFAIMDASEAAFYGLNDASLETPDGSFVAPTTASIEAGLSNISPCASGQTSCPEGTFSVDYGTTSDADAYPMPDITYAVVPTSPQPPEKATALKSLLNSLVNFSHGSGASLPDGYAPLSTDLYLTAEFDIATEITSLPASAPGSHSPTSSFPTAGQSAPELTGSTATTNAEYGSFGTTSSGGVPFTGAGAVPGSSSSSAASASATPSQSSAAAAYSSPAGISFVSLDEFARFLLPALLLLALVCLVAGPLLVFVPALRRRRRDLGGGP